MIRKIKLCKLNASFVKDRSTGSVLVSKTEPYILFVVSNLFSKEIFRKSSHRSRLSLGSLQVFSIVFSLLTNSSSYNSKIFGQALIDSVDFFIF